MGKFVLGVEFDVKPITDSCQPPITDSMLKSNVPTGTGQKQSAQALYTVIETSVYNAIETCMSISYIWSAFTNVHSMRGTYLFQPKTITYIFCNANDYYPGLINSELSMRWTRYS